MLLLETEDNEFAPLLVRLVRKTIVDLTSDDPITLEGTKIRINAEGFVIKGIDPNTHRPIRESYQWFDLY